MKRNCKVIGCTDKEIQSLESYFNITLPGEYKEFLRIMGKGAGDFMKGSSVFFNDIFDLQKESESLLNENNFKKLPKDAFVFFMHQGYQFAFFLINNDDNPKIFYYSEVETTEDFDVFSETFIEFLNIQFEFSFHQ